MKKSQINPSKIETEKKTVKRCTLCTSEFIVSNHILLLKSDITTLYAVVMILKFSKLYYIKAITKN